MCSRYFQVFACQLNARDNIRSALAIRSVLNDIRNYLTATIEKPALLPLLYNGLTSWRLRIFRPIQYADFRDSSALTFGRI